MKWANGWRKILFHYGAIIRLHIKYYCRFMEGYSVYIGKASTLLLLPQLSDFVPLKNGFYSVRAQTD